MNEETLKKELDTLNEKFRGAEEKATKRKEELGREEPQLEPYT